MKQYLTIIFVLIFASCSQKKYDHPRILITTQYGDIEAELYPDKAPKSVAAFISYIDSGYYKNTTFYRVLKDDELPNDNNTGLIQGGLWPKKKNLPGIPHESTRQTRLTHENGTLSLARLEAGSATTEFFICIGEKQQLDAGGSGTPDSLGYAAFGKVIKGMKIVRKIQNQSSTGDHFDQPVTIRNIELE